MAQSLNLEEALARLDADYPWPDTWVAGGLTDLDKPTDRAMIESALTGEEKVILEVGTVFGGSARAFLSHCPKARIICLGEWPQTVMGLTFEQLGREELTPSEDWVWDNFLSNTEDIRESLISMRCEVEQGLEKLLDLGVIPDLIYVEGGGEFQETLRTLKLLLDRFPRVKVVGRLTTRGDILKALNELTSAHQVPYRRRGNYWILGDKPSDRLPRKRPLLMSVHIPKTAGTSFGRILEQIYKTQYLPAYKGMPQVIPDEVLCVHGHFLGSKCYHHYQNVEPVTWLRNPVERVISHYRYFHRRPDPTNPFCRALHEGKLTLLEFASIPGMMNRQTKFVDDLGFENFRMIGLTERFGEGIELFANMFAREIRLEPLHLNAAPSKQVVCSDVRHKLEVLNEEDVALYRRAGERFEKAKAKYL